MRVLLIVPAYNEEENIFQSMISSSLMMDHLIIH